MRRATDPVAALAVAVAAATAPFTSTAGAAPDPGTEPPLAAVASHETTQRLASGVTRVERWRERITRSGSDVWTERISFAPRSPELHASGAGHGHKHFDFETAARWLHRERNGSMTLRFVDVARRVVVEVPPAEWGAVGFDGRWDAAASFVPQAWIESVPDIERRGVDGTVVKRERAGGWVHEVRWSPARRIALRIDSVLDSGRVERHVSVALQPGPVAVPWKSLVGFDRRYYDDYLD